MSLKSLIIILIIILVIASGVLAYLFFNNSLGALIGNENGDGGNNSDLNINLNVNNTLDSDNNTGSGQVFGVDDTVFDQGPAPQGSNLVQPSSESQPQPEPIEVSDQLRNCLVETLGQDRTNEILSRAEIPTIDEIQKIEVCL